MTTPNNVAFNNDVVQALKALADKVGETVLKNRRCCLSCAHWTQTVQGGCKLAGGQLPPPHVIAYGCGSYVEDDIPF